MKTNKVVLTMAVLAVIVVGAMTLSAFTSLGNATSTEKEYSLASSDWKLFRENVPYCDGGEKCMGYGKVWVNTDTYQVAFDAENTCGKTDLSEYTGKDGYNMRFWNCSLKQFCYVNIFVPRSAFN
jgi:hypothetical protein